MPNMNERQPIPVIKLPPKYVACLHCRDNGRLACDHEAPAGMTSNLNPDYVSLTRKYKYLVTTWYIAIKTAPHASWMAPQGWGPYYTEDDGKVALAKADKLWMSVRLQTSLDERMLTRIEVADLKRQGATVSSLGEGK